MTKSSLACGLILTLAACASSPSAPGTVAAAPAAAPTETVATAPAAGVQNAPAPTSTAAPTQAPAQAAKPKLICEEDKPLGTLIPQRICMTPEEAAARRKAAQDKMREIQNQSATGPGMGSSSGG